MYFALVSSLLHHQCSFPNVSSSNTRQETKLEYYICFQLGPRWKTTVSHIDFPGSQSRAVLTVSKQDVRNREKGADGLQNIRGGEEETHKSNKTTDANIKPQNNKNTIQPSTANIQLLHYRTFTEWTASRTGGGRDKAGGEQRTWSNPEQGGAGKQK